MARAEDPAVGRGGPGELVDTRPAATGDRGPGVGELERIHTRQFTRRRAQASLGRDGRPDVPGQFTGEEHTGHTLEDGPSEQSRGGWHGKQRGD